MERQPLRPLFVTAFALALVVPILIAGGFGVRASVRASLHVAEQIRAAQSAASLSLRYQLDEETGVRGYAVTRDPAFLEPYRSGRVALANVFAELRANLVSLGLASGTAAIDDAAATNAQWLRTVAEPIVAHPARSDADALQRRGKLLVDRIRRDLADAQEAILSRERVIDGETAAAIDRINLFVLGAVIGVGALGVGFGMQQTRLARRLVDHRREASELRVAYATEKRVADTLKDAFVQKPLPSIPGVRFSATYTPAAEEAKVGGDWYDLADVDARRVLFIVGDVAGHGLDAAVAMIRARQELMSAAVAGSDASAVLQRGNVELLRQRARMVTAVCGTADAAAYRFTYAAAGHPPPVLVEPGRAPRLLECGGMPLGLMANASYVTHSVQTVPGAMLVLYTDGALEHSHDVIAGERILLDAVAQASRAGAADAAGVIRDAIFAGRSAGDDVAILTIAFAAAPAPSRSRTVGAGRAGEDPGR